MGASEIDVSEIGNVLRALKLNPSLTTLEKLGTTERKGKTLLFPYTKHTDSHWSSIERKINIEDMLSLYGQAKYEAAVKEGSYADFIEIFEMYDRHQDRRASAAEISTALTSLGKYCYVQ